MNKLKIVILLVSFSLPALSQQVLLPIERMNFEQEYANQKNAKADDDTIKVDLDSSKVIFIDDFSTFTGRLHMDKWSTQHAYPNYTFGAEPRTIGVVTMDGLNPTGYPYNFGTGQSTGINDSLTSLPMELGKVDLLQPDVDSLYLFFDYQPQGNNPFATQEQDSIVLEFFDESIDAFRYVWSSKGYDLSAFRRKHIKLETKYYYDGFRFRFYNVGNQAGSVDHWHLDNIVLMSGKLADIKAITDFAFQRPGSSVITDYKAMPWHHYNANATALTKDQVQLWVYNFSNTNQNIDRKIRIYDEFDDLIWEDSIDGGGAIDPMKTVTFNNSLLGFDRFPNNSAYGDVTFFRVENFVEVSSATAFDDFNVLNNTINDYQVFGSHYAYDDGTAEAGYGVVGTGNELAVKFVMPDGIRDTLTSVDVYFNPVVFDRSIEKFQLAVWEEEGGEPGDLIHLNDRIDRPDYGRVNEFERYDFDATVLVEGTFYVGWLKLTKEPLNVGFDANTGNRDKTYYRVGGIWKESSADSNISVNGSLMLRPVFRDLDNPVVGVNEIPEKREVSLEVYPNPARDQVIISTSESSGEISVFNLQGVNLHRTTLTSNQINLDISAWKSGMYLVVFQNEEGSSIIQKLIVQK